MELDQLGHYGSERQDVGFVRLHDRGRKNDSIALNKLGPKLIPLAFPLSREQCKANKNTVNAEVCVM
jgi:hypothetical protein